MKILNLYSCLGGNRFLWPDTHEITAIENDIELAKLYKERFKNDNVIVCDAHNYLLENYQNFDFIWSSPPCPSHSKARFSRKDTTKPIYPDLKLYEEIIFLKHNFKGKFCIENVIPYYKPLISGQKRDRHIYWCNFILPSVLSDRKVLIGCNKNEFKNLCEFHNINLDNYTGTQRKDKIARNLVDYKAGLTILETALNILQKTNSIQTQLF